jgi:uncharacterized spore protein YtfJ
MVQTDEVDESMNVDEMLTGARDAITVKRVFGDPIERDGLTIIPAADVRGGGGGGAGSDAQGDSGGGGGFGLTARPVGVYVVRGHDVHWEPAVDATRLGLMGMLTAIVALFALRSVIKALARR